MDVEAVICAATRHHAVNISPHALPYFALDYDVASQLTGNSSLWNMCVCADVKASVCMWKCLLLKPPPTLYIVYLWGGLQHFGAYNPFSVLNTPTLLLSPCRARTLNLRASLRPFPPPPPPNTSTAPARLRWRWGTLFYGAIRLVCLSQILFLRLAYTFLQQMVYIPRQGAVLNQLAAPCSWDKVETLSSARFTGD